MGCKSRYVIERKARIGAVMDLGLAREISDRLHFSSKRSWVYEPSLPAIERVRRSPA
jgi:hypothetical protein